VEIKVPGKGIHRIECNEDPRLTAKLVYLYRTLDWLKNFKHAKFDANPLVGAYKAHMPWVQREPGKMPLYAGFADKIEGKEVVVLSDSLSEDESIGILMHEIIHKTNPHASESEVQAKNILYLEKIAQNYHFITDSRNHQNFTREGVSPHTIPRHTFQRAYENQKSAHIYGVNEENYKRLAKGNLERLFTIISLVLLSVSFLTSSSIISGATILEDTSLPYSTISALCFIGGVITLLMSKRN